MNTELEKEIERAKKAIKLLNNIKADLLLQEKEDYHVTEALPYNLKAHQLNGRIWYLESVVRIADYYQEKLGEADHFNFGKYIGISFDVCFGAPRLGMYLANNEIEGKLYNRVFGSHSGINEWFEAQFSRIISVVLGATDYSHAFGSWDFADLFSFFKHAFYKDASKGELYWDAKDFDKDVEHAKKMIDFLVEFSNRKELIADIDEFLDVYFEKVFKNNPEE